MSNILVVDDDPVTQRLLKFTLKKHGHAVTIALHGLEALDYLEQIPIDVAIIDYNMPEMNGLTLLKHLRADPRFESLPIIMLTGQGEDEYRQKAQAEGVNAFLNKPSQSRDLADIVNQLLKK